MEQLKKALLIILCISVFFANMPDIAAADSINGYTEGYALTLEPGKAKSAAFQEGRGSVYFWIALNTYGKLKLTLKAKRLESDATITLYKQGEYMWRQVKTFRYSEDKRMTGGTLTSEYILPSGGYYVKVTPEGFVEAGKKLKLSAKFIQKKLDDVEPNNTEETAQPLSLKKSGGKTAAYHMLLSDVQGLGQTDSSDCFAFTLKKAGKLWLRLTQKDKEARIKVILRKKTAGGYKTLNTYETADGRLDKKVKLKKGAYCIKVWYDSMDMERSHQVPYTISAELLTPVGKVSVNKKKVTLWTGGDKDKASVRLRAAVSPKSASNQKVKWTTSNPKVAKVSASGKVTAVKAGRATIKATATDGSGKYAKCMVTVVALVTKVTLDKSGAVLWTDAGKGPTSIQLKVKVSPENAGNKSIAWTTSNARVAKVSASGKVTAVAAGTATIKAAAKDGSGKYALCKVTVKSPTTQGGNEPKQDEPKPKPRPIISGEEDPVNVGETITFRVTNGVTGGEWFSSDTSVLAFESSWDSGLKCKMRGKKVGIVDVYYKANGKQSNKIEVFVRGV